MEQKLGSMTTTATGYGPENGLGSAANNAHKAVDKAAASVDGAIGAVRPAVTRASEVAHQAVDKVAGVVAPTAEWLSKQAHTAAATGRTAVEDARTYMSTHPWQSVTAALAVGYLLGRRGR